MPVLLLRREAMPVKAKLCVCWAGPLVDRAQSHCCFVWGKLWHPTAIICGRKYLMFLEEID